MLRPPYNRPDLHAGHAIWPSTAGVLSRTRPQKLTRVLSATSTEALPEDLMMRHSPRKTSWISLSDSL